MKFSTLLFIVQFILYIGCTKPSNHFHFEEGSFYHENKFYSQTIIDKANEIFLIKNAIGGIASQDKEELIIRQIVEEKIPADTVRYENENVFPSAYVFYRDYLKEEIKKGSSLQGGTLVVLVSFYYQGNWQGDLIFKYPFYQLSF